MAREEEGRGREGRPEDRRRSEDQRKPEDRRDDREDRKGDKRGDREKSKDREKRDDKRDKEDKEDKRDDKKSKKKKRRKRSRSSSSSSSSSSEEDRKRRRDKKKGSRRSRSRSLSWSPPPAVRRQMEAAARKKAAAERAGVEVKTYFDGYQWVETSQPLNTAAGGLGDRRLMVQNLPPEITEDQIKAFFNACLAECGVIPPELKDIVISVWISKQQAANPVSGVSSHKAFKYAFVQLATPLAETTAIGLSGINCMGHSIRIQYRQQEMNQVNQLQQQQLLAQAQAGIMPGTGLAMPGGIPIPGQPLLPVGAMQYMPGMAPPPY
mmetsp:Transcript_14069/g.48945  ORF Transcript_14069/g.48945 Transcript_14069/m.48945 type:complete len:323 (+) Transcript_14069:121-1089(+)